SAANGDVIAIAAAARLNGGGRNASDAPTSPPIHSGYTTSAAPSLIVETASGSLLRATQRGTKYGSAYSANPAAASGARASSSRRDLRSGAPGVVGTEPAICASRTPQRSSSA